MIRVIRTPRPGGVDKRVVQTLLNVADDLVLECVGIVVEQPDASSSLFGCRFVSATNCIR
jgi:hypothetical protein